MKKLKIVLLTIGVFILIYCGVFIYFTEIDPRSYKNESENIPAKTQLFSTSIRSKIPLWLDSKKMILWDEKEIILFDVRERKAIASFENKANSRIEKVETSNSRIYISTNNRVTILEHDLKKSEEIKLPNGASFAVSEDNFCVVEGKKAKIYPHDSNLEKPKYEYTLDLDYQPITCNSKNLILATDHPNLEQKLIIQDLESGEIEKEITEYKELIPSPNYQKIGIKKPKSIEIIDTETLNSWSVNLETTNTPDTLTVKGAYIFVQNSENSFKLLSETPSKTESLAEIESPIKFRFIHSNPEGEIFSLIDKTGEVWILQL